MGIYEVKRAAKLSEWQRRNCECRTSGQPVKKWCEEHHILIKTYYRWECCCIVWTVSRMEGSNSALNLIITEPKALLLVA